MKELATGCWPQTRSDGKPFDHTDAWRKKALGSAMPLPRGVLLEIKGDWSAASLSFASLAGATKLAAAIDVI